jgi:beta-N-acetylhexosaminidase
VVFTAIDPDAPATLSKTVIGQVIRGAIGFDGLLMTDDLSMQALSGGFRERAEGALAAGCDMVLHCNGELSEMRAVAEGARPLEPEARRRADAALAQIASGPEPVDIEEARARFEAALR